MNHNIDIFARRKRTHSNAILEEIPTIKHRKINIHQYEEITSIATFLPNNSNNNLKGDFKNSNDKKNGDRSESRYINFNNNSNNKSSGLSQSPNINRNLDISDISNVAENNSIIQSEDSFFDLIDNFSLLDLTYRDKIVNKLLYGQNENKNLIFSNEKKREGNYLLAYLI